MSFQYNGQIYLSDDDLNIKLLGFWPKIEVHDSDLKEVLKNDLGLDFISGDIMIAYIQRIVSSSVDFDKELFDDIKLDIQTGEKLSKIIFKKTATGIGRGHSLGGLSGIVLGINGTKMIDSALTGIVASRSLVTSGRRKTVNQEELVIPKSFANNPKLLEEYILISKDIFADSKKIKEQFGKLKAIETFNKILPYNNPANLMIVLSLDSAVTLYFEVQEDKKHGPDGKYLPKEIHALVDQMPLIMDNAGLGIMYRQRIKVPRDTYLHYTVFKDPDYPNYSLELAEKNGFSLSPKIVDLQKDFTNGFLEALENAKKINEVARKTFDKNKLIDMAMQSMLSLSQFTRNYNESLRIKIADTISFRVWSEQKRHATLRQDVESIYTAADRAYCIISKVWPEIENAYKLGTHDNLSEIIKKTEQAISIFKDLKENNYLLLPYIYHSARQIMFYKKLIDAGFERRDAIFVIPRNIMVRTIENYDLENLINLEFPLRLCSSCEAERYESSWKKQYIIVNAVPELKQFLGPKCWGVGICTEGQPCKHIYSIRKYLNLEEHKELNKTMLK